MGPGNARAGIAFLIVAHEDPLQLAGLCAALGADGDPCFVHLDRQVEAAAFVAAAAGLRDVRFIGDRHAVHWGGWGLVEATFALVRSALANSQCRRFCLLSGACFPCRPLGGLKAHLAGDAEFVSLQPVAHDNPYRWRYDRYHLMDHEWLNPRAPTSPERGRLSSCLEDFLQQFAPSPPCAELDLYGGWTWWTLTRGTCERLLREFDTNPFWRRRFRYTFIPDEIVVPSMVARCGLAARCSGALHYIDWSEPGGPRILTIDDLPAIERSGAWFARKLARGTSDALYAALSGRLDDGAAIRGG